MIPLINEYRGDVIENIHFGRICIVDQNRNVVHSVGDVSTMTYFRSASKPIQALPVLALGLDKKYNFTERETALLCGSHAGEKIHLETVLSMLKKIGVDEEEYIMLPAYPMDKDHRDEMLKNNIPPRKALHNCSGKHVGIMALAKELTGKVEGYWKVDHPAQKEILKYISMFTEYPEEDIKIGIDGCGVPVFAVPLKNMAVSYMKLACPEQPTDKNLQDALKRLQSAINNNSVMLGGTNQLCDVFNRDKNVIAKGGAQGVYCFGLKKEKQGFAGKIEDGPSRLWPVMVGEILKQINYDNKKTVEVIDGITKFKIYNDNKAEVGKVVPVFKLS